METTEKMKKQKKNKQKKNSLWNGGKYLQKIWPIRTNIQQIPTAHSTQQQINNPV